jgi:hypothetical protein
MPNKYLSSTDIEDLQGLRQEFLDIISNTRLDLAFKNYLKIEVNSWLDEKTKYLYREGTQLPPVEETQPVVQE